MKTHFAFAVLISAAAVLTPANATTIIGTTLSNAATATSLNLSLGTGNGYIVATGYDNGLPSTLPVSGPPNPVTPGFTNKTNVGIGTDGSGVSGLGLANNSDEVGPTDFVVLDFSHVVAPTNQSLSSVAFTINIDVKEPAPGDSDWVIYGENTNGTATLVDSGAMSTLGKIPVASTTTTALYTSYIIGIVGDCELDVEAVNLTYNTKTPEPGTFVMSGMALIGLGLTMKKRRQNS